MEAEKRDPGNEIVFLSLEASNREQSSCRCTLDQWLDLIGVTTIQKLNILSKSRYNADLILVVLR